MIINSLKIIPCLLSTLSGASLIKQPNKANETTQTTESKEIYFKAPNMYTKREDLINTYYGALSYNYETLLDRQIEITTIALDNIYLNSEAYLIATSSTTAGLDNNQTTFKNASVYGAGYMSIVIRPSTNDSKATINSIAGGINYFYNQFLTPTLTNYETYINIFLNPHEYNANITAGFSSFGYQFYTEITESLIEEKIRNVKQTLSSMTETQFNQSRYLNTIIDNNIYSPETSMIFIGGISDIIADEQDYIEIICYWNTAKILETNNYALIPNQDLKYTTISFDFINTYTEIEITTQKYTIINNEVIDIPSIMFEVLTMPFTFISTAFNLTLFPGTQYMINISDIVFMILGTMIIIFLVKLIFSKVKG